MPLQAWSRPCPPFGSETLLTDRFGRSTADIEGSPIGMGSVSTPIEVFFKPRSVAVIGATWREASVGRAVLTNLMTSTFGGTVYPVNPKHERVLGLTSYPRSARSRNVSTWR
jgi:hypothetical protein